MAVRGRNTCSKTCCPTIDIYEIIKVILMAILNSVQKSVWTCIKTFGLPNARQNINNCFMKWIKTGELAECLPKTKKFSWAWGALISFSSFKNFGPEIAVNHINARLTKQNRHRFRWLYRRHYANDDHKDKEQRIYIGVPSQNQRKNRVDFRESRPVTCHVYVTHHGG